MEEQEKSKLSRPELCAIIGAMKKRQLKKEDPIAIMDSGLGGISVLRQMKKVMPLEDYLYFGDSVHAPYGERPPEEIIALCEENTEMLLEQGAKCIVIACNTATSAAAEVLRSRYPEIPVIGMEPAVKPAAKSGGHPKVLVLATPITIRGDRLHHLVENFDGEADFTLLEAPGIVRFVEAGICDANPEEPLMEYLRELLSPYSMQADGRLRFYEVLALDETGSPEQAFELMEADGGLVLDDLREGETNLGGLWQRLQKKLTGKEEPVPYRYDFKAI